MQLNALDVVEAMKALDGKKSPHVRLCWRVREKKGKEGALSPLKVNKVQWIGGKMRDHLGWRLK